VEQRKSDIKEENHIALAEVSFSFFLSVASFENKNRAAQLQPKIRRWTLVFLSKPLCPAPSASEYYRLWMDIG